MSFIVHIFVVLFICFRIHFVCLLNVFTEVYSYLWMAVYLVTLVTVHDTMLLCNAKLIVSQMLDKVRLQSGVKFGLITGIPCRVRIIHMITSLNITRIYCAWMPSVILNCFPPKLDNY